MLAKINSVRGAVFIFALVALWSGCTPAGSRALLQGKKDLDQGDVAAAVEQFRTATTLLPTNAGAWNYYGVALQHAGQPAAAADAYKCALELNRDLVEAHFNLGSLWLEQNQPANAATEFTAYTLRRGNDPAGWLKLGSAQLKLGEIVPAEKSFSIVYRLDASNPEAMNGLGLARIQRGKPKEAAQWFAAAVKAQPNYAPAILNLATTAQQYLHDTPTALENYRAYLALTPHQANWDDVNAVANALEQSLTLAAATPAPVIKSNPPPAVTETKPQPKPVPAAAPRPVVTPKSQPLIASEPPAEAKNLPAASRPVVVANPVLVQVVQVPPAPQIVTTPNADTTAVEPTSAELPMPEPPPKTGLWHKLFNSGKTTSAPNAEYLEKGLTPLPSSDETASSAPAKSVAAPVPVVFPRYNYLSPGKPAAGDRRSASGAFTKARVFEQDEKWVDAEQWYHTAAQIDPAWFEAQYNTGVMAQRMRNYPLALSSYEYALAIRPDSADARYYFSLALKAAGYVPDAVAELKKMLAANPGEVRAHLALASWYALSLHDTAQARSHYKQVLELDPNNSQASDIRFWLSANPE